MAHVTKFAKGGGVGHLLAHYERRQNDLGEYVKFGNQDIDLDRTLQNYNCSGNNMSAEDVLERCENHSKKAIRDNMNIMCSWVITQPQDLPMDESKEFFEQSYTFLEDRYGKENVISSWVHMDETTPHMHFAFTPITAEGRLSAKEILNRDELKAFHGEFQAHLEGYFQHQVNILNEATINGNKSIAELKRGVAERELTEKKKQLEEMKDIKPEPVKKIKAIKPNRGILGKETVDYEEYNNKIKSYNNLLKSFSQQENVIKALKYENKQLLSDFQRHTDTLSKIMERNPYKDIKALETQNNILKSQIKEINKQLEVKKTEFSDLQVENKDIKRLLSNARYDLDVSNIVLERSCIDILDKSTNRTAAWEHIFRNIFKMDRDSENKLDTFKQVFDLSKTSKPTQLAKEALKQLNSMKYSLGLPPNVVSLITKLTSQIFKSLERKLER